MTRSCLAVAVLILAAPAGAQPMGELFTPMGGHFTIRFPAKPKEKTETAKSPIGDLKVFTATYALADGNVYMTSYTDFPEGATKPENRGTLFDGVREGLRGKDGKLLDEKDVEVGADKLKGRDIEIEKDKKRLKFRIVLRDNRLYQVAAIGTSAFVAGKEVDEFFKSFELAK